MTIAKRRYILAALYSGDALISVGCAKEIPSYVDPDSDRDVASWAKRLWGSCENVPAARVRVMKVNPNGGKRFVELAA